MSKTNKDNQNNWEILISKRVQLLLTLAGVFVALLNIWIASKLSPIAVDIALIQDKVEAQELDIVPRSEIEGQLENIDDRLNRIESKLDRVIEAHVE